MTTAEDYARYRERNADVTYTMCEYHDAAGECQPECVILLHDMGDGPPAVDYDPTGCSYPEPRAFEVPMLDAEHGRVFYATVHEWQHTRKGHLTGWVAWEGGEWMDLVLYGDHRAFYVSLTADAETADGTVHRLRKSMVERLTDLLPHENGATP